MINFTTGEYCQRYYGVSLKKKENYQQANSVKLKYAVIILVTGAIGLSCIFGTPILAKNNPKESVQVKVEPTVYLQKNFEENIKNKYKNSYITFPTKGLAHIKKVKYINSKPIKINIVELNTRVNPYLKIKPQIAGSKLNNKSTIRKIAQKEGAIVAVNGGFFKPQTGVPLGALMIDKVVLTGPIYNRVGIAIFEGKNTTDFKLSNINFDIKLRSGDFSLSVDNINQPRMLSSYTLIYTSDWGKYSPIAPKGGLNALIRNKKIVDISSGQLEIQNGDIILSAPKEKVYSAAKLNNINLDIQLSDEIKDATHIIAGGPYLIKDNQVYIDTKTQKLQAISGKNPRSAIGFDDKGSFILVTVDGREQTSVGMTLTELASLMKSLGCTYAMNLDGGSSSAMYVNGKIVNSALGKEGIAVSNALAIFESNPDELQLSSI